MDNNINNNNINTNSMSGLYGTRTEQNLMNAFEGESKAYTKYKIYALKAGDEGYPVQRRLFDNTAENEREHAELWLSYLGEVGDTADNLEYAIAGEADESENMYLEMARVARDEGFNEIADKFMLTASVEANHKKEFENTLSGFETGSYYEGDGDTVWQCLNCGYEVRGTSVPARCPLCSYPRTYFKRVSD